MGLFRKRNVLDTVADLVDQGLIEDAVSVLSRNRRVIAGINVARFRRRLARVLKRKPRRFNKLRQQIIAARIDFNESLFVS